MLSVHDLSRASCGLVGCSRSRSERNEFFVDFATLHCLAGAGGAWSMMRKAEE